MSGATRGRFARPRGSYGAVVYMSRARRPALVNVPSYLASMPPLRCPRREGQLQPGDVLMSERKSDVLGFAMLLSIQFLGGLVVD